MNGVFLKAYIWVLEELVDAIPGDHMAQIRYHQIPNEIKLIMLQRPRRNRKSKAIRALTRETILSLSNLIYPLFLVDGEHIKDEVLSLPGNYRWSLDTMLHEIESCINLGLQTFILFPKIKDEYKDATGTHSYDDRNIYLQAAKEIKAKFPDITLISDVALDPYSIHGHDGIVRDGAIVNDDTVDVLVRMAIAQAHAGFDIIGPSDMMDGRVGAIREGLDEQEFHNTSIMSYTAKYASAFYGPFRDALDSAPVDDPSIPKDKKSYQMDPANKQEALIEGELDEFEGADFLMVKPAIHYMDVIHLMKNNFNLPIAAYHVSGECAMLTAACQKGWLDFEKAMPETLLSLRRAGADAIITYFAKDYAQLVKDGKC